MLLRKGSWELTKESRFYRLEDRLEFIFLRFGGVSASDQSWWSDLGEAIKTRNDLVHPRDAVSLEVDQVRRYLRSILDAVDSLYTAVFKRGHPAHARGMQSQLTF
jgi:hypothetical protein